MARLCWIEQDRGPELPGGSPAGTPPVRVALRPRAWQQLCAQLPASPDEEGGLLCGTIERCADGALKVVVHSAVPAGRRAASPVHLAFVPGTWQQLLPRLRALAPHQRIVGWYHSHPGLGAFFSATDRHTQRACFAQPWQLGLVLDPVRGELALHVGARCAPPAELVLHGEAGPPVVLLRGRCWARLFAGAGAGSGSLVLPVRRVLDARTLLLGPRRLAVRLPGLLLVPRSAPRASRRLARAGRAALARRLARRPVQPWPLDPAGLAALRRALAAPRPARRPIEAQLCCRGELLAALVLRRGYACLDPRRAAELPAVLRQSEQAARSAQRGLWAARFAALRARLVGTPAGG
ncbi:MAG: hypothetical protein KatS3mg102_1530 [Planctomycetota bacterium]|nr:MAG: hypothetical protein KatS3mg102_1530 [Planctomycetota bacterium]